MNDLNVIDRFLATFIAYIDSGFGLLGPDVGFLTATLIGIDITLAGLFWAMGGEDNVIGRFLRKILYIGAFAFILNSFSTLADVIFRSFAQAGLTAGGGTLAAADLLKPGRLAGIGFQAAWPLLDQASEMVGLHDKREVHFLARDEIDAILAAPDRSTWIGRRDHMLLHLMAQTGLRLSEVIQLERGAVVLGAGAHVRCLGKGRKERCTPLTRQTSHALQAWLREAGQHGSARLFPNIHGGDLSADAVQRLLARHVETASLRCASLRQKRVTPHVLRHSAAMELLQAGVDCSVIALWLGHESIKTTQVYLHAHLALKEAALAKIKPFNGHKGGRYKPADRLLAFLDAL